MADHAKYKRAVQADVAYNMMRLWQGAVGVAPVDGLVSPAYVVARPHAGVSSSYYAYLFRIGVYMEEINKYSHGIVTDRNRLYWDEFKQMPSVFPPPDEQRAITRYLDHQTLVISRLIQSNRTLIAQLNEQKQAFIHQAVTRGLDPNVRLASCESRWFPELPEGWMPLTLRRVVTTAVDGPHFSPTYTDAGIPFLSARNVKAHCWSLDDVKFISESDYRLFSQRVHPEVGDVLFTKGGTTGVARAVDLSFPFQVWVHIAVLKLKRSLIDPQFLAFALNSPRCYEQSQLFTRGATNQDLGLARMKEIQLPVPPSIDEQEKIAGFLNNSLGTVDSAISQTEREISLIREYRTRLVADVVTGRVDVREVALGLPADAEELVATVELYAEDESEELLEALATDE